MSPWQIVSVVVHPVYSLANSHCVCLVATALGLWLEALLLIVLPRKQFDSLFGRVADVTPLAVLDAVLERAWRDIRMHYYLLTSTLLNKLGLFGRCAFELTLALRARGLSNSGSDLLAMMSVTKSKTSFYRAREELVKRMHQKHRYFIKEFVLVVWEGGGGVEIDVSPSTPCCVGTHYVRMLVQCGWTILPRHSSMVFLVSSKDYGRQACGLSGGSFLLLSI